MGAITKHDLSVKSFLLTVLVHYAYEGRVEHISDLVDGHVNLNDRGRRDRPCD